MSLLSMYLPNPTIMNMMEHKVNFKAEYSWFEFMSLPSPRLVSFPRLKSPDYSTIYPEQGNVTLS